MLFCPGKKGILLGFSQHDIDMLFWYYSIPQIQTMMLENTTLLKAMSDSCESGNLSGN